MKIAILGTGVMGRGWMTQFAMFGHEVYCFDTDPKVLAESVPFCTKLAGKSARRLKIDDPEIGAKTEANIHLASDMKAFVEAAKGCDVFFEIIIENMRVKRQVLKEIVPQLPAAAYFWSNTSSLDIDALARASGRPDRSIVAHGMNPVPMMTGVELVPGAETSPGTVEFCRKILLEMNKVPFVTPNVPGFWVNRLLIPQMLDAMRLLEQGMITVEDGDAGLQTCLGHPQGTFKLADFISLPTMLRVALEMYQASNDPRLYPPTILVRLVKEGHNGTSSGMGFYDWSEPKSPKPRDFGGYHIAGTNDLVDLLK